MLGSPLDIVLCRYQYDALNQTIGWAPRGAPNLQRFYRKDRLATEIQAAAKWSFFEYDHHVLAQRRQTVSTVDTTLLAIDQQRSVLNALDATPLNRFAYSPYGFRPQGNGLLSLLGFNGERPDPVTGHYHLGNGYRQFNTVLMRFNSPDSWSPFGRGGLNGYAYCEGDPVNMADPTGHGIVGNLAARVKKESGKPLNSMLIKEFHDRKNDLGGTKEVKKLAKKAGITSEEYLLDSTIEHASSMAAHHKKFYRSVLKDTATAEETLYQFGEHSTRVNNTYNTLHGLSTLEGILSPPRRATIEMAWRDLLSFKEEARSLTRKKLNKIQSDIPHSDMPSVNSVSSSSRSIASPVNQLNNIAGKIRK